MALIMNDQIFRSIVEDLCSRVDKNGNKLAMDGLIVLQDGKVFKHIFTEDILHDTRSVCKCVVALCFGIAQDEGVRVYDNPLSEETLVWDIIKNKVNLTNHDNLPYLKQLKVKHLLTHTVGYDVKLLKSKDVKDIDPSTYLDLVINYPIKYEPGNHMLYSNAAPYILSAFMQEVLQENISSYAKRKIFCHLGIQNVTWKNYGDYCAACTGMKIGISDLAKIALLLLQNGEYDGRRIVSEEWVQKMKSAQILTPDMYDEKRAFPKYAYGYYLWVSKDNIAYIDGTNGQYIILIPKNNLAIVTTGNQSDMKPITKCFEVLK